MNGQYKKFIGIIGITGMPGAKKTIISKLLSQKCKIPYFQLSETVKQELESLKLDKTPPNYWKVAIELRKQYGSDVIAKRCWERVRGTEGIIILDGIRNSAEVKFLKSVSDFLILVSVHSSPSTRFERVIKKEDKFFNTYSRLSKLDNHNLKLGIGEVIALADYVVINEMYYRYSVEEQVDKLCMLLKRHSFRKLGSLWQLREL